MRTRSRPNREIAQHFQLARARRAQLQQERADVVLPLAEDSEREIRLRCVVRPDKAQAALLDRLGLSLPERLRPPAPLREM